MTKELPIILVVLIALVIIIAMVIRMLKDFE